MADLDEPRLAPGHRGVRAAARVLGPLLFVTGAVIVVVLMTDCVMALNRGLETGNPGKPPSYFSWIFLGIPMVALGFAVTHFGYLSWFASYVAVETAPVQKDTFNYLAHGVRPGVTDLVQAARDGLRDASPEISATERKYCAHCGQPAGLSANFCSSCGQKFDA